MKNFLLQNRNIKGTVIHGKGLERERGFPTANMILEKVPDMKWWGKQNVYLCNSKYGPGIMWRLKKFNNKIMVYFIDMDHKTNIYGETIELKNVTPITIQRESNFLKTICKGNLGSPLNP